MGTTDLIILAVLLPLLLFPAWRRKTGVRERAADRFAAGRDASWFVLGGSIAATSLSTDTPLLVAGAFYSAGIAGNWFWLARIPGSLATLFFFARYWKRSGVLTEPELLSIRYGSSMGTRFLRVALAIFDGGVVNILVLASVTYGAKILIESMLGVSGERTLMIGTIALSPVDLIILAMVAITVTYTVRSGFSAVIRTDLAQLTAAILASVVIAFFAVRDGVLDHAGLTGLIDRIPERERLFDLFSDADFSLFLLLGFTWWQTAPGGGLLVQRLISAKSETDATLTTLWFTALHYVIRVWPWFIIGAVALIYFPGQPDQESAYPLVAQKFLPIGGIGLAAAAFWAAYTSTLDSRLNWAASYFVNDVYATLGYDRDGVGARKVENVSIFVIAALVVLAALSSSITSLIGVYKYLMVIQAGAAFASIARWYWWRMNEWAEISALIASLVFGNIMIIGLDMSLSDSFSEIVAINSLSCAVMTVIVAVITSKSGSHEARLSFARVTRIAGPGWQRITPGKAADPDKTLLWAALFWLASTILLYSLIGLLASLIVFRHTYLAAYGASLFACVAFLWMNSGRLIRVLRS